MFTLFVNKEVMKSKEYVAELGDKEDQKIKEIVQAGKQFDDHHKNNKAA